MQIISYFFKECGFAKHTRAQSISMYARSRTRMQEYKLECKITNSNARAWNANARSRMQDHEHKRETYIRVSRRAFEFGIRVSRSCIRVRDLAFTFHARAFEFVILHSRFTLVHSSSCQTLSMVHSRSTFVQVVCTKQWGAAL